MKQFITLLLCVFSVSSFASWDVFTATDPITDDTTYHAYVVESSANESVFAIRCKADQEVDFFLTEGYPVNKTSTQVVFRIDSNQPKVITSSISGTGYARSMPFQHAWLNELDSGQQLVVRTRDNGVAYDYIFTLQGFRDAFMEVWSKCTTQ